MSLVLNFQKLGNSLALVSTHVCLKFKKTAILLFLQWCKNEDTRYTYQNLFVNTYRMTFSNEKLEYDPSAGNTILDYQVSCIKLHNLSPT